MRKFLLYIIFTLVQAGKSEDVVHIDDVSTELTGVNDAYFDKQTLIPVNYTNMTMEASIDISLASVNSFDELGGYLEISGYFTITWNDQSSAAGAYNITLLLPSSVIWKPPLLLVNSIKGVSEIGDSTSKIRCNRLSWACEWKPWIVLRGGCTPDVRYYPFDRQTCSFKIAVWGHTSSELRLKTPKSEWNMDLYVENAEWNVENTSSEAYIRNNISFAEFTIDLKRIPTYYVINLISPVILLALVNVCVFILPAESGERVGFSITCFLSFVVLLNIIMGFIPSSGTNLAYLCYYTFVMMVFSCGMSLATVFSLWIHFKSEDNDSTVPAVLRGIVYVLKCRCFAAPVALKRHRISHVAPMKLVPLDSVWDEHALMPENPHGSDEQYETETEQSENEFIITWKHVASVMDIVFLLGFLAGQIFYSVGYLLPIILNQ